LGASATSASLLDVNAKFFLHGTVLINFVTGGFAREILIVGSSEVCEMPYRKSVSD